ncbi:MAG: hypothetical protein RR348_00900, partial [Clostridia bacterium]
MKNNNVQKVAITPLKKFGAIFGVGFLWAIKVTILTFFICILSSMLAGYATAKSNFALALCLLLFLIFVS